MPEVCAAMGLTSLDAMDHFLSANIDNYHAYREGLRGVPGIRLLQYDEAEQCNYQYVVLEADETRTGLPRDELRRILHSHNVLARRYFWPGCHRMEPYRSLYPNSHLWLPETERISAAVLVLPTGATVTPAMASEISAIIREAVGAARRAR